jgi:hypothetical protein
MRPADPASSVIVLSIRVWTTVVAAWLLAPAGAEPEAVALEPAAPLLQLGASEISRSAHEGPAAAQPGTADARMLSPDQARALLERAEAVASEPWPRMAAADFSRTAMDIEQGFDSLASLPEGTTGDEWVRRAALLVRLERRVDRLLDRLLGRGAELAALPDATQQKDSARKYLSVVSRTIDMAGRVRYRLFDALYDAAYEVASMVDARDRLVGVVADEDSSVGALVMSELLFDPPPNNPNGALPADPRTKHVVLDLIARTGSRELLPAVARFVEEAAQTPDLVVAAVETIRRLGLPQDARPGQDPTLPKPVTTAALLRSRLASIDRNSLSGPAASRFQELAEWLERRAAGGLDGDRYRLGRFDVEPGDWLLMRNPSPYNLFTDLSPGLFTHVGVIVSERSTDGRRRMVLVDLPERGRRMEATNVDLFVERTLHYVVLRHEEPEVAAAIAGRAHEAIGCATEFDLNFRTERVLSLRGQPLNGRKIHTYCAGLLLLCAQETGRKRSEFFPIAEGPAEGRTVENLAKLGITFGRDFVSPTGALFSPRLRLVGRRDVMYEPGREIEQIVYDHFAERMRDKSLQPTADLMQSLRGRFAEVAAANPQIARALANAAGVGPDTDLVSAARALTVIETLDRFAMGNSAEFRRARSALLEGPVEEGGAAKGAAVEPTWAEPYRHRHRRLKDLWDAGRISPRELRIALVEYYVQRGKHQIDTRFFSSPGTR